MHRLLSSAYWLGPIPGGPAGFRGVYMVLAAATLGATFATWIATANDKSLRRRWFLISTVASTIGLVLVGCAFRGVPFFSMRLLVFGTTLVAITCPLVAWVVTREPISLAGRHWQAMRGNVTIYDRPFKGTTTALLLALHLAALTLLAWHTGSLGLSALGLGLVVFTVVDMRRCTGSIRPETLAPLALLYGNLSLRLLFAILAQRNLVYQLPNLSGPFARYLDLPAFASTAFAWSALLHGRIAYPCLPMRLIIRIAGGTALVFSLTWAAYTYTHHTTHGVTATDPYCYAQMGIDLARRGAPFHEFPLVAGLNELGLKKEAGVHLGYHWPFDGRAQSATVWPAGYSILLAIGYRLGGERGLYLTTPLVAMVSLAATAALVRELLHKETMERNLAVAAVAVFLLATSYTQLERLVVLMADAAAQLFSTIAVLLMFRSAQNKARWRTSVTAGLMLGIAYWMRHTQLVLGVTACWLALASHARPRDVASRLAAFALGVLPLLALDLAYHQHVMGHWLRPESLELKHFGLSFMARTGQQMVRELLSSREFLFVSPMLIYGVWRLRARDTQGFWALGTSFASTVLFHLPYEALRLRDLLPVFPILCVWTGYGMVEAWQAFRRAVGSAFLPRYALAWLMAASLLARSGSTLMLYRTSHFDAFGYLNASQRASFDAIAACTPDGALIGASLNSGPIDLYSERVAFRPAVWSAEELYTFVDWCLAKDNDVYLLNDGLEMQAPMEAALARYHLRQVGSFDLPFYHTGGGSVGRRVALYGIEP